MKAAVKAAKAKAEEEQAQVEVNTVHREQQQADEKQQQQEERERQQLDREATSGTNDFVDILRGREAALESLLSTVSSSALEQAAAASTGNERATAADLQISEPL